MATLNIEGQSVQVDDSFLKLSPEQQNATVDEIAKTLKPQAGITATGLAKSAGVGAIQGLAGLAGAPADLANLAARGYDYLRGSHIADTISPVTNALGSENILKKIEGYTGELPKPQNRAEEVAQTAGSFLPLAAAGPGGIIRRVAANVLAPAAGSEIAKEATKGTALGPYAQVAGAVIGGGLASKAGRALASNQPAIDSAATQIKTAATDTYKDITARAVSKPVPQSEIGGLVDDIRSAIENDGMKRSIAGKMHDALDELKGQPPRQPGFMERVQAEMNNEPLPVSVRKPGDVADLVAFRQTTKQLLGEHDANKAAAVVALPKIDAAIERLSPGTMAEIRLADKNYAAVKANEALDKRLARADLRAAGDNSGMNLGNKIKQNVTNYLLSNESRYLSPENRASLEKIPRGTFASNAVRLGSNLLGGGGGLGATLLGGAAYETGHPELAAAPIVGFGLRGLSNRLTLRQAQKAAIDILSRSPTASKNQALLNTLRPPDNQLIQSVLRALIAQQSPIGAPLALPAPR